MITVYRLLDDVEGIKRIRRPELWKQVASGALPLQTARGHITGVYMGSMGDWPMFTMRCEDGTARERTREMNGAEFDTLYKVGAAIEIDYVVEHSEAGSLLKGEPVDRILEIRIGSGAMAKINAVRRMAIGTLTLDEIASNGSRGRTLHPLQRPTVQTSEGSSDFHYSTRCGYEIHAGESVKVTLGFHDADVQARLPMAQRLPFGTDGVTRGTIVVDEWLPSARAKPPKAQAMATITVDRVRSRGTPGRPLDYTTRPMARQVHGVGWYTFIVADDRCEIGVGETATVEVAFLNEEGARVDFPIGMRTVFGDGPAIYGTFVLERWLDAD